MNGLSPEELAELHVLEAAIAGQSIVDFVPRVSPVMPGGVRGVAPRHLLPIANKLAQAEYEPVRVCLSVPPRHGKTELIIHAMVWWLSRHPEQTIMYCSYQGGVAAGKAARAKDLAIASGCPVNTLIRRSDDWRTTAGGGVIASGVGGALTGMGCNLLIVDDPVKNREEAESPTYRQRAWDWFKSTAMTRVTPRGSVVVVHTRWHPDDLIGRLAKEGWEVINLPAYDEDAGTFLWPEGGWDAGVMEARRKEVGEYDWAALFMGQPRPRGGRMFEEPAFYDVPQFQVAHTGRVHGKFLVACDPAATASTHSDYSVILAAYAWLGPDGLVNMDVLDVWRSQVEQPTLVRALKDYSERWQCPVGVEAQGGFKGVPQALRAVLPGARILDIPANRDKFTRALPASAAWNGVPGKPGTRRIRVPKRGTKPWLDAFLREVGDFTGVADAQDDQVDALAHAYWMAHTMLTGQAKRVPSEDLARYFPFGA